MIYHKKIRLVKGATESIFIDGVGDFVHLLRQIGSQSGVPLLVLASVGGSGAIPLSQSSTIKFPDNYGPDNKLRISLASEVVSDGFVADLEILHGFGDYLVPGSSNVNVGNDVQVRNNKDNPLIVKGLGGGFFFNTHPYIAQNAELMASKFRAYRSIGRFLAHPNEGTDSPRNGNSWYDWFGLLGPTTFTDSASGGLYDWLVYVHAANYVLGPNVPILYCGGISKNYDGVATGNNPNPQSFNTAEDWFGDALTEETAIAKEITFHGKATNTNLKFSQALTERGELQTYSAQDRPDSTSNVSTYRNSQADAGRVAVNMWIKPGNILAFWASPLAVKNPQVMHPTGAGRADDAGRINALVKSRYVGDADSHELGSTESFIWLEYEIFKLYNTLA